MNAPAAPKPRINRKDPAWAALARETRLGSFVFEGHFAAFPLCFPGVTVPIPRDESRVTALATDAEGLVYGATTGRANHVFFACFQATSGVVLDLQWPDPSARCAALCVGAKEVLFAANPAAGGGVLRRRPLQGRPGDLLHEWSFARHPFEEVPEGATGQPVLDAVATVDRRFAVVATATELLCYDFAESRIADRRAAPTAGRLCAAADGAVYGIGPGSTLWRYRPESRDFTAAAARLPAGSGDPAAARWASDRSGRFVYLVTGDGRLLALDAKGTPVERARFAVTPVTAAGVTHDGRLFAFAGEGIAHFHIYEPAGKALRELGAAVSVLERRRYGYAFAAAAAGTAGEIFFGEDDDLGHLWLYFPTIPPA